MFNMYNIKNESEKIIDLFHEDETICIYVRNISSLKFNNKDIKKANEVEIRMNNGDVFNSSFNYEN